MKFSTNTLRFLNEHYGSAGSPSPDGIDALVEKIGAQLGAVEEITPFGRHFEGALVVKVISCEDHPNADRLHVCKVDDGGKVANVDRDEQGHVQVVCGAPNVRAGLTVVWLPPGATVPNTIDKDPFVLESRPLRGIVSNGMLASPRELTIGDNHDGILEVDTEVAPGTLFADAFNVRDDVVIDIENKMFTHRPDCFGWLGIAREIEGISQRPYKSPDWYQINPSIPSVETESLGLEVRNEIPELVPRFTTIAVRDVTIKQSPLWLQIALTKVGIRPINNIVDYTNFFMLETGQPLHAYDYDKVKARSNADHAVITVRKPHEGEKITLLNGKEITPRQDAIMIAAEDQLIGVGGVMGGADTDVDDATKNIIIESANFNMYSIRRTSMEHGLFTDAVSRFNKGQSPLQTLTVLGKIVDEICQFADGKVASAVIDDNHLADEVMKRGSLNAPVEVSAHFINERLGLQLSAHDMKVLLENVEFEVEEIENNLSVKAPFWRTDIEISEDIVEEVGRLYGFDHLPLELPKRSLMPTAKDGLLELKTRLRSLLVKAGANELLTYSFVHGEQLDKVGQDRSQAFQLSNALSPELQYYRLSLTPSLLEKVHANIKAGFSSFAIFELGKAHNIHATDESGLPAESDRLALVFAAADKVSSQQYTGAAYYEALKYLTVLDERFTYAPVSDDSFKDDALAQQMMVPFVSNRAAVVLKGGTPIGVVGEYKSSVQRAFKLPIFSAGFELLLTAFEDGSGTQYVQLPRFPRVEQDICLRVNADMSYAELFDFVAHEIDQHKPADTIAKLSPVDIYQRDDDHKQITLRLNVACYKKTMRDEEVEAILRQVAEAAHQQFGAERI